MTPFGKFMLVHETKDIKMAFDEPTICCEAATLEEKMQGQLSAMEAISTELEEIVRVRMKRDASTPQKDEPTKKGRQK